MSIKKVFIVGSGAMGTGIAQVCAISGYDVYLNDIEMPRVEKAIASIEKRLASSVAKGRLDEAKKNNAMCRITPHVALKDAADCDLVIEAAAETMEIKKAIFTELDSVCRPGTILASNTSSISITDIASVLKQPENFIGLHFFNPVPVMKLLEIICGFCTSSETLTSMRKFGESLGKTIIVVKDGPAFLVNRILNIMLNEAIELLDQGYGSVEDIDNGMLHGCAHPMGPLALADLAGIDIHLAVMETLYRETGDSKYRPSLLTRKMVRAGYLGQKTGKGFYIYDKDGNKSPNPMLSALGQK